MANVVSSYADVIRDWEALLLAVLEKLLNMPEIERYASMLQGHLEATKQLKAQQDSATATRQRLTQELQEELMEGKATAIRLRGVIKAALGHTHEGLVQYGMTPRRRRVRRPKLVEGPGVEDTNQNTTPSTEGEVTR
jgi:hypothetical protein